VVKSGKFPNCKIAKTTNSIKANKLKLQNTTSKEKCRKKVSVQLHLYAIKMLEKVNTVYANPIFRLLTCGGCGAKK